VPDHIELAYSDSEPLLERGPITITISASMDPAETFEIGRVQFDRDDTLTDPRISARLTAGLRAIADELEGS
jgi:hypothetical protein